MLERLFELPSETRIPEEAFDSRRVWIGKVGQRVRLSPDQMQARMEELEVAELIFSAKSESPKA